MRGNKFLELLGRRFAAPNQEAASTARTSPKSQMHTLPLLTSPPQGAVVIAFFFPADPRCGARSMLSALSLGRRRMSAKCWTTIVVGLCAGVGAALASAQDSPPSSPRDLVWEPIYEDNSRRIEVETTTIKRLGNNVTATLVTIFTPPRLTYPSWPKSGLPAPVKYWYEKIIFRCGAYKFSTEYDRLEDAEGNELRSSVSSTEDGTVYFFDIAINTDRENREIQYEAVCGMRS